MRRKKRRKNGLDKLIMLFHQKMKLVVPLLTILIVLVTATTLLALAEPKPFYGIVVDSGDCGLKVTQADELVDVSNLNPGDTKTSYLIAENTKDEPVEKYYFNLVKMDEKTGIERVSELMNWEGYGTSPLSEVLQFTILRDVGEPGQDQEELFDGYLSEFSELDMGELGPDDEHKIYVTVHLSGPDVGNEYQGSNVSVQFQFRAACDEDEQATLEVRKFNDVNRSRSHEGQPEIRDWAVYISSEEHNMNNVEYTTPVRLDNLAPGTYTVREETRSGWTASTSTRVDVTLEAGDHETVWFGNYRPRTRGSQHTLRVQKFHDLNRDGNWDRGEPEIQGWKVEINGREYETPVTIRGTSATTYRIKELSREGWVPTTETEVEVRLSGNDSRTVVFGNYQDVPDIEKAALTVQKFHDMDGDGSWGEDEPEIVGWTVFINGEEYITPVNLVDLEPGEYVVREGERAGWFASTPTEVVVQLKEGARETVLFGNRQEIVVPPEDPGVGPEPDPDPEPQLEEEMEITPEIPAVPPEPDPEPGPRIGLPRTGEIPPYVFYGAGILLIVASLLLRRRRAGKR